MEIRKYINEASQPSTELNLKYVLFSLGGILLGVLGNMYVRKQQEKEIIDTLTAEIESLKQIQTTKQLTPDQNNKLIALNGKKELITKLHAGTRTKTIATKK